MRKRALADIIDASFHRIAEWSIQWRWLVIAAALALLASGLFFASKAKPDNSISAYFDKTDPTYTAYMAYLDDFLSDEVTYILYRVPNNALGPFDIDTMRTIAQLSETLETEVPFARDVTSLTHVELIQADGDFLTIDEMAVNFPETQAELLRLRDEVFNQPLYIGSLIDETLEYAAIIIDMERTSTDPLADIIYEADKGEGLDNLYPQVSNTKVREILARPEYQGIEFILSGDVVMNAAYNEILGTEATMILMATLVLVVILAWLLFRATWVGILGPISVVLLSVVLTVGVIGLLGWNIGLFFSMVPTLLCAVGVAQSVHILLEYQRAFSNSGDRNSAVKAALKKVGGPCFMAALTTAAGFAVMSVSEMRGLRELAIYSALGILITFVLSVTLLVVFLARSPSSNAAAKPAKAKGMAVTPLVLAIVKKSIDIDFRFSKTILVVSGLLFVLAAVGISKLKIDFNFLHEFKPHVEFRSHTERAEGIMGGILNVTYIVDTDSPDGIKNKDVLHAMDKLQRYAETHPLVKKSYSPVEVLKDLNKSFNGGDPAFYTLPTEQDLVSQYFLVYEVSGGDDLHNYVYSDFSRAVIEFRVEITHASDVKALVEDIDQYLIDNPVPTAEVRKTGIGLMWIKVAEYIGNTQLLSYSLVFSIVAAFMCITFGSFKVGLLSMVPNLAPVAITLGFMGWFNVHLDYMKLLLATIAIGIAVDDTIHLVSRYRSRFLELGNYQNALEAALMDVGPALTITSMILVGAFTSYYFSNMAVLTSFGALLAATVTLALLADLFLMPVLIMKLKPFGPEFEPKPSIN